MRTFGGGTPLVNAAFHTQFNTINANVVGAFGAPIALAGFTEVRNAAAAVNAFSGAGAVGLPPATNLCAALGVNYLTTVNCGSSALGYEEYVVLASNAPVYSIGRVSVSGFNPSELIHETFGALAPVLATGMHPNASGDYRSVVYMVADLGFPGMPRRVAAAFFHNVYVQDINRTFVMQRLPAIVQHILSNPALAGSQEVYLGGDFNVLPQNRRSLPAYAMGTVAPAIWPGTTMGGTTIAGNLYDYWYANPVGGVVPNPVAFQFTMGGPANNLSDHAGIGLLI
ncbi:MAG: hypothetical protein ACM3Q1_00935 [Bacteroidales bacterium]